MSVLALAIRRSRFPGLASTVESDISLTRIARSCSLRVSQLTDWCKMSSQAALHEVPGQSSFLATQRGKLTLAFLCMVGFLDFVDASIVNVALPSIRRDLH